MQVAPLVLKGLGGNEVDSFLDATHGVGATKCFVQFPNNWSANGWKLITSRRITISSATENRYRMTELFCSGCGDGAGNDAHAEADMVSAIAGVAVRSPRAVGTDAE